MSFMDQLSYYIEQWRQSGKHVTPVMQEFFRFCREQTKSYASEDYLDERFCKHCDKYTKHRCRDSEHERDSSSDYQQCQVCKWWRLGLSGRYDPPISGDYDESK